jgi:type II secretory pathway pseudopilin PulG
MKGIGNDRGHSAFSGVQKKQSVPICAAERKQQSVPISQTGVTLIELVISLFVLALLFAGLSGIVTGLLGSRVYVDERVALIRDAEFAMDRIVRNVSHARMLLLPLADNPATNWPENIREQTVPASPPIGSSSLATAVLAVTLPEFVDLDFDGVPDADDDQDGQIDEDVYGDVTLDSAPGIYQIDDDGDGAVDEGALYWWNDDEDGAVDEDPVNGIDDDNDGSVDEDFYMDANLDGEPGVAGIDEDGDGSVDEGSSWDNDEDGSSNEDSYDPLVYFLAAGELIERLPVPWDENANGVITGRDFVASAVASNVTRLRFERVAGPARQPQLVDITLELTTPAAGTVALNRRVRVGGAL